MDWSATRGLDVQCDKHISNSKTPARHFKSGYQQLSGGSGGLPGFVRSALVDLGRALAGSAVVHNCGLKRVCTPYSAHNVLHGICYRHRVDDPTKTKVLRR